MANVPPSPRNKSLASSPYRGILLQNRDNLPEILVEMEDNPSGTATTIPNLQETMCMLQMMSLDGPLAKLSKKKPVVSGISIPGISNIFGQAHVSRRIVWTIVVVAAIIIATIQVKDRVEYYSSTPVTVNVRVTINDTLRFPVLTICNKNVFSMTQINLLEKDMKKARVQTKDASFSKQSELKTKESTRTNISQLVGFRGMDIKQLWDLITHDPKQLIEECWFGRNVSCNQVGQWKPVYTYMGVCYSFILNENSVKTTGMFNNLYVKLVDKEDKLYQGETGKAERGWKMLIHDPRDSAVIDIRTHGSTLDPGWGKDIRIYLRQFRTLNVWKRPCVSNGNYSQCIERCFVTAAAARMSCRLPFMDESVGMQYCDTPDSYWNNVVIIEKLLFHGHWTTNNCTHCQRQCNQDIYVAFTEMTQMKSNDRNTSKISKLRLFYQDFTFDEIEESADYGAVSLLCDIGGSLGFLLGFSVLTVFEIVDAIVQTCLMTSRKLIKKCRGIN